MLSPDPSDLSVVLNPLALPAGDGPTLTWDLCAPKSQPNAWMLHLSRDLGEPFTKFCCRYGTDFAEIGGPCTPYQAFITWRERILSVYPEADFSRVHIPPSPPRPVFPRGGIPQVEIEFEKIMVSDKESFSFFQIQELAIRIKEQIPVNFVDLSGVFRSKGTISQTGALGTGFLELDTNNLTPCRLPETLVRFLQLPRACADTSPDGDTGLYCGDHVLFRVPTHSDGTFFWSNGVSPRFLLNQVPAFFKESEVETYLRLLTDEDPRHQVSMMHKQGILDLLFANSLAA